jgi:hypothetical protein
MAKKLSQLDSIFSLKDTDILSITVDDGGGSYTSKKMTVEAFVNAIANVGNSSSSELEAGYSEVLLTISGMPPGQANWNGLGNGTHGLDGEESGPSPYYHNWHFPQTNPGGADYLRFDNPIGSNTSRVKLEYNGVNTSIKFQPGYQDSSPPYLRILQDRLFDHSLTINGVTFHWTKGLNWDDGGMAYSNSSSSISDSTVQQSTSSEGIITSSSSSSQKDQYGEVVLTISGYSGSFNGLGNGVHYLDGQEFGPNSSYHRWFWPNSYNLERIAMRNSDSVSRSSIKLLNSTTADTLSFTDEYTTGPTSYLHILQDRLFGHTFTLGDGSFTVSKGANWEDGGMAYSNSSSTVADSTSSDSTIQQSTSSPTSDSSGGVVEEVSLIISGMSGANWNGLGNGTHALDGCEYIQGGDKQHIWWYGCKAPNINDYLVLWHNASTMTYSWLPQQCKGSGWYPAAGFPMIGQKRGAFIKYTTGNTGAGLNYSQNYSMTDTNTYASITYANTYSSVLLGSASFTWSLGTDWSRGNM